jgi:hypothetical protein
MQHLLKPFFLEGAMGLYRLKEQRLKLVAGGKGVGSISKLNLMTCHNPPLLAASTFARLKNNIELSL